MTDKIADINKRGAENLAIALREASPDDEPFLFKLYASTRLDELKQVPWNDEQKQAFLSMQFSAQRDSYRQQFPLAEYSVILHDGTEAGRLIVDRSGKRFVLMDIAILPDHRNAGIATTLIRDLQSEAQRARKPLGLHVEQFNPALSLYERMGFERVGLDGIYWRMEWTPAESLP